MESSRPWPWPRGQLVMSLALGAKSLALETCSWSWSFSPYVTVNFITNFENLAIKMKLVITSPAINVCFELLTEQQTILTLALTPSLALKLGLGLEGQVLGLDLEGCGLDSKSG